MTAELIPTAPATALSVPEAAVPAYPRRLPPVPWRDPHTVPPALLKKYIADLEKACEQDPKSASLRTGLGMAYAMNLQVYKSMDALELAVKLEPDHFFAQLKYAELNYRLRALIKAEAETLKALELAETPWEYNLARKQLQEIRLLMRHGTQKPEWTKSLRIPSLVFLAMLFLLSLAVHWK
jgi:tetratricopeptide (TPR) repeat protein